MNGIGTKKLVKKIIPFQHFSIKTELCPDEIVDRLNCVTDVSEKSLWNPVKVQPGKDYFGNITLHEFKIVRHISHQNSFYPVIYGTIQKTESFTIIDIKQKMAGFTQAVCWLGLFFCLICCAILWKQPLFMEGAITIKIFPYILLAFGYSVTEIGFWHEANLSKDELKSLLS